MSDTHSLELQLQFHFKNAALLKEALTHRSYLNERSDWPYPHNERLEYLGDAVLELAVTEALFEKFPQEPEGQLTVLRAALVNYQMMAKVAMDIGLNNFVLMSRGEAKDTGKAREVILANALEAVIGAMYLDAGLEATRPFIVRSIVAHIEEVVRTKSYKDPKSSLQEIVQERLRLTPVYRVIREEGPAHQRTFTVGVFFGERQTGEGSGSSKQDAEVEAAKSALSTLQ